MQQKNKSIKVIDKIKEIIETIQIIWLIITCRPLKKIPKRCPICGSSDIAIYGYDDGGWYCRECGAKD